MITERNDTRRRASQTMARGVISRTNSGRKMQEVDIRLLADENKSGVEHWEPYGITAAPHEGAEALVAFPTGKRSHAVVIAVGDRRYRLKGLQGGEVALYDDQGQKLLLGRDGIAIVSAGDLTIDCQGGNVVVTGDVIADGVSLKQHIHSDVEPGIGNTGGPVV
ncbi:phage baseplate assembly protein V [Ancylobacter oerskovii]|uniref:Phage baseplate assembly protein V n=1 Tax=Ancylobacter oerskovii TaxID=459519 RepID=A0ABW4Z2R9_9HYPH|nr:phage baseplate assembly protein V [Ancylobacter oerskovii]MBS7546253.1 phage baseplate assembly protein [Ancylobacter oerskovii]